MKNFKTWQKILLVIGVLSLVFFVFILIFVNLIAIPTFNDVENRTPRPAFLPLKTKSAGMV